MPESWEQLSTYILQLEHENKELQRELAQANDYIEHMRTEESYR